MKLKFNFGARYISAVYSNITITFDAKITKKLIQILFSDSYNKITKDFYKNIERGIIIHKQRKL